MHAPRHPPLVRMAHHLLLGATLLLLLTSAFVSTARAAGTVFETLGIALTLPEGNGILEQRGDDLILGDEVWKEFLVDRTADSPAGLLVQLAGLPGSELRYYRDDSAVSLIGEERVAGILFESHIGRDTFEGPTGEVPIIGRILIARYPLVGGRFLVLNVTHAGLPEAEALTLINGVLASLEVRDAKLLRDEVPVTVGLGGMVSLQIPLGMQRTSDFDSLFIIETDDYPTSFLHLQIGNEPLDGYFGAVDELARHLKHLTPEHRIERQSFMGEPVIAIELEQPGRFERVLAFERCLPGDQLLLLETTMVADWRSDAGLPVENLNLNLPDGMSACPDALLAELRSQLGARSGAPQAPPVAVASESSGAPTPAGDGTPPSDAVGPSGKLSASTARLEVPLELPHPGDVRVRVEATEGLSIYLRLIDVNASGVIASDTSGTSSVRTVEAAGLAPGTYLVRVERQQGEGEFRIISEASAPRVASEPEPNDDAARATAIPVDGASHALLGYGNALGRDTEDYFTLTLPDDGDLRVTATADAPLTIYLRLLDVNGSGVVNADTSGTTSERRVEARGLAAGTYYLRVTRQAGEGAYTLAPDFTPIATASDPEPNDRVEEAAEISLEAPSSGRLGYGNALGRDTEDYFAISLPDDGDLNLTLQADADLALYLRLLDVNGSSVIQGDTSGTSSLRRVDAAGLAAGRYFVRVTRQSGQGGYLLTPSFRASEIAGDLEPNHAPALAARLSPISIEEPSFGRLGYGNALGRDTEDYFAIVLPDDGDLRLTIEAQPGLTIYARLIDVTGSNDLHSDASATESRRRIEGLGLRAGTYFVRVTRHQGQGGYQITPTFTPAQHPGDTEPNDHAVMAQELSISERVLGRLGYGNNLGRDVEDYFALTLPEGGSLTVRVEAEPSLMLHLRLYDPLASGTIHADTSGSSSNRLVEGINLPPGTYYLRLSRQAGQGSYTLSHEVVPAQP